LDGGAASSSSSASAATPPPPGSAVPDWVAEQARHIAAYPYGDAGNEPDAAVAPSFLGSFTEADVRAAVGRGASPTLSFRIAEWPAHPNQLLALSFQSVAFGAANKSLEPRVTLLERRDGVLTRLAEVRIERKKARCSNHFDPPDTLPGDGRAPNFKWEVTAPPAPGKSGYFDLLLRMKITVQDSAPQAYPEPPVITAREATQRFTWDGTRYRALSAAPD